MLSTSAAVTRAAAGLGFLAVALGAFGAHGLKDTLARHGTEAVWQTAVLYHVFHALALLALGARARCPAGPAWCFVAGVAVFSGSLYVLAVTGFRKLGMVTPLGGLAFLAGWAWLAWRPAAQATDSPSQSR